MNSSNKNTQKSKAKAGNGAQQSKRSQKPNKTERFQIDTASQTKSRKSEIGSTYNDGQFVRNKPVPRKVRKEDFDEVVIAAVNGSVAFNLNLVQVNPGISAFFPRLSKFAQLYEKYRFDKLEFYFQHDVSQFASQGTKGLGVLSALFDATQPPPENKQQMEMTDPHVVFMPNQNALLTLDRKRLHPNGQPLYVRGSRLPGGTDRKLYDPCVVYFATQGNTDATEIGELHCRGTVTFFDEIVDSVSRPPANKSASTLSSTAGQLNAASGSFNICLLDQLLLNGLEVTQESHGAGNGTSVHLPPGNYMIFARTITTATGLMTNVTTKLQLNGSDITAAYSQDNMTGGTFTALSLNVFQAIQVSGSAGDPADATIDLLTAATYSTGTVATIAQLSIVAI